MDDAEIVIAARRTWTQAMQRWMTVLRHTLRIWTATRRLEREERSRTSAATTASWPWWRT